MPGVGGTGGTPSDLPPAATCVPNPVPCAPTTLDSGISAPGTFHVQDGYLYWRNSPDHTDSSSRDPNSVVRLRLPDGVPELVTSMDGVLSAIAVDATHVYVADVMHGLARAPITGGAPEFISTYGAAVVAVDDTHAFFTSPDASAVVAVPKGGGDAIVIPSVSSPLFIAVDATHVYWTTTDRESALLVYPLHRALKTGAGAPETLATLTMRPERLRVIDGSVYISASAEEAVTEPRGALLRVPVAGGEPVQVATFPDTVSAFGADADRLYVATCPTNAAPATVYSVPSAGGPMTAIAQGGVCLKGVAVDATNVYFADWGDYETGSDVGAVLSANKCGCQ